MMQMIIAGPAGSGKSAVGRAIAEKYKCVFLDVGQLFRKRAKEMNMSIEEFNKFLDENLDEDKKMDEYFVQQAKKEVVSGSGYVLDWRMGFKFMPEVFSVYLDVDELVGAERIFQDKRSSEKAYKTVIEVMTSTKKRLASFRKRMKLLYDVDVLDARNYTVNIDTSSLSLVEVIDAVEKAYLKFAKQNNNAKNSR